MVGWRSWAVELGYITCWVCHFLLVVEPSWTNPSLNKYASNRQIGSWIHNFRGEHKQDLSCQPPRKWWLITKYSDHYIYSYIVLIFFENGINLGSVLQCHQHVVDECFHMWEISSSSFTSHIFAVELYSYIYSFMRCYLHFHTFRMQVLTQVTGVDRVAKDHPTATQCRLPRGPSPARLQVQVTEGGQKRRGLRWQRERHDPANHAP